MDNLQLFNLEAPMLVDEISTTEYYIGVSENTKNTSQPNWRIKKISKSGTTWLFEFPNGDQDFKYAWDLRLSYDFSA